MDIQAEKIALVKLLLDTENPEIIASVRQIFKKEKHIDFWDDLTKEQQAKIRRGSTEIEQGRAVSYEAFMANYRS